MPKKENDKEKNITDTISNINTGIDGSIKEGLKKADIPKIGKNVLGVPSKIIDGMLLTDKVAKSPTEKEKFIEVYKWSVGSAGATGVSLLAPLCGPLAPACAGGGVVAGNIVGEWVAEKTANIAYPIYKTAKDFFTDSKNDSTLTIPFSLQIKDYNTFAPLSNKQIQLTNIDSKQIYTQTTIKSK